jgi:hypothetical protein
VLRTTVIACAVAVLGLPGLLGASVGSAAVQPDLVGGQQATGDTSWMASVQYEAPAYGIPVHHMCGGVLLFRSWVVTNAHCVTDRPGNTGSIPMSARTFSVRAGSKDRTQGGETAKVVEIKVHPGWQWAAGAPQQPVDDIAMLELDHPVTMQPIQLAAHTARPGDRVTLYGWGADQPDGDTSHLPVQLQQLRTTVLSPDRCADAGQVGGRDLHKQPARHGRSRRRGLRRPRRRAGARCAATGRHVQPRGRPVSGCEADRLHQRAGLPDVAVRHGPRSPGRCRVVPRLDPSGPRLPRRGPDAVSRQICD